MARQNENGEWVDFHDDDDEDFINELAKNIRPICIGTYHICSHSRRENTCEACGFLEECKKKRIKRKKQ